MSEFNPKNVRFIRAHDRDVVTITDGENTVEVYGVALHDFVANENEAATADNAKTLEFPKLPELA